MRTVAAGLGPDRSGPVARLKSAHHVTTPPSCKMSHPNLAELLLTKLAVAEQTDLVASLRVL